MSILTRHLVWRVLVGIGLVALAVVSILTLVDLIDEARRVHPGGYSFADALWVIALTTPQRIYEVLPVSVFIGSLLSLGQLVADNEMTALRASGMGVWWLSGRLLSVGLLLALVTILIGEKVAPVGVESAWDIRHQSREEGPGEEAQGLWIRKGDRYFHVLRGNRRDLLSQVLAYRLDARGALEHSLHAESARFTDGHWILHEVRESVIHPNGSVTREQHAVRTDVVLPGVDVLDTMLMPADEMPVARLDRYLDYFESEEIDLRPYRFARWQRFATPLACVVVLLLTVSFTFTQSRGGGLGQRIFIGVISGIGIYLFNRVGGHLGMLGGLPPWQAAFLPLGLLFLLGVIGVAWHGGVGAFHSSALRARPTGGEGAGLAVGGMPPRETPPAPIPAPPPRKPQVPTPMPAGRAGRMVPRRGTLSRRRRGG